ncbi:ABC transporter ATP-binding protein [Halopenitus persicus]|uniref:ABC transporter ATP-binding protein n=1 Tax=Halopenitus persicus TaxID=1048396 RepID=UPI000BBB48FB|nr:ABC transporter ATP-binding protein [Halopenitus persicus]
MTTERETNIALETRGLTRQFGQLVAVDEVDLTVEKDSFHCIIGPNGAGKTTLFNLLSGALSPTSGSITLNGRDITNTTPEQRVHYGLGRSFQISDVFTNLTVKENIRLGIQSRQYRDLGVVDKLFSPTSTFEDIERRTAEVLEQTHLMEYADTEASALSYGNKRRLEISIVLATDPEVVLLDEPTAGMSRENTMATIEMLQGILADKTLVLVEHDIDLVMELADRITVLHNGATLAVGSPNEIADSEEVNRVYLGET